MTILGAHRGPVSGMTHIHLLRESPAVRTARSANPPAAAVPETGRMEGAEPVPDTRLQVAATPGDKPGR
jgi:hypothetical protein